MVDPAAINSELDAMVAASTVTWPKIKAAAELLLADATMNGGVVTYNINGRSVTKSISELREIIKMASSRIGGGIIMQSGAFP